MNSRERVLAAIAHREPDRVPLNIWMFREDVREKVVERYGSLDAFYQALNIDLFMVITPPATSLNPDFLEEKMNLPWEEWSEEHLRDPDDPAIYADIQEHVDRYGKDNALFVHVWGVLENLYGFHGVEESLARMASDHGETMGRFAVLRDWSERVAENVLEFDIDVLHISGDCGQNGGMIMSPGTWREMIKPNDREIIRPAQDRGMPTSLHSCGDFTDVLDEIVEMGIDVIHPVQESAGMDQQWVKRHYGDKLTVHGGLDIRHLLSRSTPDEIRASVKHKMDVLKPGGGFIFNTAHTVQMDTPLENVEAAYEAALEYGWY